MKKTLFGLLAISLITLAFQCQNVQSGFTNINESEMKVKMEEKDHLVIDVRTPQEVSNGFIKGTDFFFDINGSDFEKNIASLDKTKSYIVYCHSGARSSKAASYLTKNGFTVVYNLSGGISSWRDNSYIVNK